MLKTRKGFTLIELLITMTIIAILSGVGVSSFMGSQKRGRDVRRQSDLNQYRIALENYASVNGGVYPVPTDSPGGNSTTGNGIFSTTGSLASYISGFPKDPQDNLTAGFTYYYRPDSSGLNWVLQACMENSTGVTYEICSNGKAGTVAGSTTCSTNPDYTCDLP